MVDFTTDGEVGCITLNRPPVNAIDEATLASLAAALDRVEADASLRVLLIRAEGKRFCGGADIEMLRGWTSSPDGSAQQESFSATLQRTFGRIAGLDIPSIAAIRGAATGGGLELALACDLRVVAPDAPMGLTEVRLGLLPGAGGTQRLTETVGRNMALRLMLRGEIITGAEAHRLGLAEFVHPEAEVETEAKQLAAEIAQWPRPALTAIKTCVLATGRDGYLRESQYTRALSQLPETHALIAAFFDRRK